MEVNLHEKEANRRRVAHVCRGGRILQSEEILGGKGGASDVGVNFRVVVLQLQPGSLISNNP